MYFNGTKCCSLIAATLLSLTAVAKDAPKGAGSKPLCFIENKGQVVDQDNHPRSDIQYSLSTPGVSLYLGNGQLHYQFKKTTGGVNDALTSLYGMDVKLKGANVYAKVDAKEEQPYYETYFTPQFGQEGMTVHSFGKITYKDVYPNIDWVFYVKNNKVEYDFVVRPGGNIADIKMEYGGATSLKLLGEGSLVAVTPMGEVKEHTPFSYETATGNPVASRFVLDGNTVSFSAAPHKGGLTIDPFLLWSTYFGGTLEDVVTAVKESAGFTYVTGYSNSTTLGFLGFQTASGGSYDAFVTKYNNTTGARTFTTYLGGTGDDRGFGLALDNGATPNIFIGGTTTTAIPAISSPGAYHAFYNGGTDGFIAKINNAGTTRAWCTYYGGSSNDHINAVACDAAGNVFVAGQTLSPASISSSPLVYQNLMSGVNDAFLAKFNTAGAVQWSTYFGGPAGDEIVALATDVVGNVILTGVTNSATIIATPGAYQTTLSGTNDAFVAKFNTSGARIWGTYLGGAGTERGNGVVCHPLSGKIGVVGNTSSSAGVATPNGFQTTYGGGVQDAFLTYLDSTGAQVLWSTYVGGNLLDYGIGVSMDVSNNLVMAGYSNSTSGVSSLSSFQTANNGGNDAFVAKFNTGLGQRLWSTYFGGLLTDVVNGVSCDLTNDQVAIVGYTTSAGLYSAGGISSSLAVAQSANAGGLSDGFVSLFKKDSLVLVSQPFNDTIICPGGTLIVPYTLTSNFAPGNVFTVQLTDAAGSFVTNIGSVVSNLPGSVTCTIPMGTTIGSNYRIRIASSNPAYVSPDDYYDIQVVASLPASGASVHTPLCVGSTILLFDTASYTVSTYSWNGPLGFVSAVQNPTIPGAVLGNAGTYSVTTTHNGCPSSTATVSLSVNDLIPPTPISTASGFCASSPINLFANPDTTVTGLTYHWSGPGGYSSTAQNPIITSATTGNTGYYVLTDTLDGCPSLKDSVYLSITANILVRNTITSAPGNPNNGPGDTVCSGTLVTFATHTVNAGVSPTYQWMSGPGTPIVGAIASTFSSSTLINGSNVFCVMGSSEVCPFPIQAVSNIVSMSVINNPPIVSISTSAGAYVAPTATVVFASTVYNGGIAPLYQWKMNGVDIPGAIKDTLILVGVTEADEISLVVKSTMMCSTPDSAVSNIITIMPNTGVAHVAGALENIALYPNPNNGTFTLKGTVASLEGRVMLEVVNALGQLSYQDNVTIQNGTLDKTISMNSIPAGVYLMRISDGVQSKTIRFAIQK